MRTVNLICQYILVACATFSIATCVNCAPMTRYAELPTLRPATVQADHAVLIESSCLGADPFENLEMPPRFRMAHGSGVLIDPSHVLTAEHVIECGYLPDIHVRFASGLRVKARIEYAWSEHDVARLELEHPIANVRPVVIAKPPAAGAHVCTSVSAPERAANCGPVNAVRSTPEWMAVRWDMHFKARVVGGNSGGGLYDTDGRLVGIVTARGLLFPGDTEGDGTGFATQLWAIRDKVAP